MPPTPSTTHAALIRPRLSLSACVRAYLSRSTLGAPLSPAQRLNYFPASPLCGITWFLHGQAEEADFDDAARLADPAAQATAPSLRPMPGPMMFNGPFDRPSLSYNPGPVQAFMVLLLPDALQALTGLDPANYLNTLVACESVFDGEWLALCRAVQGAPDDAARVLLLEDFLDPRWQALRPAGGNAWNGGPSARRYSDWVQGLALRAATSGLGRSLRQNERRIKRWAGQPLRQLRSLGRGEQSFLQAADAVRAGGPLNWAEIAQDTGYADQAHLCRESRRLSGFSPEALRRVLADEEEAFWAYRVWG